MYLVNITRWLLPFVFTLILFKLKEPLFKGLVISEVFGGRDEFQVKNQS